MANLTYETFVIVKAKLKERWCTELIMRYELDQYYDMLWILTNGGHNWEFVPLYTWLSLSNYNSDLTNWTTPF